MILEPARGSPSSALKAGVLALFVQPALPPYRVPFFEELNRTGSLRVEVWCDLQGHGTLRSVARGAFPSVHFRERHLGPMWSQPALLAAAMHPQADVLVFPWNTRYIELWPALHIARARGVPTLLWGHGYSKHESPVRRKLRNAMGKTASAVVVYSESTRLRLVAEGFLKEKVFVAPNALSRTEIERALAEIQANERLARIPAHEKVILFSSRLEPDKKPELLLTAFRSVRAKLPARLVLIGDGPLRASLESLARELGIEAYVEFLGAEYSEANIAPWMQRAHIFAYPSAIGLSLLHAFHYGVPVVTSDATAEHNPEIEALIPGENGATFRDGDAQHFAETMLHLLENESLRKRLGARALQTVTGPQGYTLENMVRGMRDAIVSVANTNSRRSQG